MSSIDWQQAVYDVIKSGGIGLIGYVPNAGHATLINSAKADGAMRDVVLTTEAELKTAVSSFHETGATKFLQIKVSPESPPRVMPTRDAVENKITLRQALGAEQTELVKNRE